MTTRSMEQKHTVIKILMTAKRMKLLGGLYPEKTTDLSQKYNIMW